MSLKRPTRRLLAILTSLWLPLACGSGAVPSPFSKDASAEGGAEAGPVDGGSDADPTLGGPCVEDGQCDDAIACTFDQCDLTLSRCRHSPNHALCADDTYCDGIEVCDPKLGCREGEPVSCSDDTTCTIDTCVEATASCKSEPRDLDGDGDPDWGCGGGDCNDTDPTVSSKHLEVCGNGKDDDCDTEIDESACTAPKHDGCVNALDVTKPGTFTMSLAAAKQDYASSCTPSGAPWRDVVAALVVPPGPSIDIDVVGTVSSGQIALSAFGQCGVPASELACHASVPRAGGGQIARIRLRSVAPGAYPLIVSGSSDADVALKVAHLPATMAPANETCGTAAPIVPGVHELVGLVDATKDHDGECPENTGDLLYALELTEPKDVHATAVSLDGYGAPTLTFWQSPCGQPGSELACNSAAQAHAFLRNVGPGTVYLGVSAMAPTDVDLVVALAPPTTPPADEACGGAPALTANSTIDVELADHTDDVKLGCLAGAVDAAYELSLSSPSDVLLVGRKSNTGTSAVLLSAPACASAADLLACKSSLQSPVRAARHALAAGSYRAVVESSSGSPMQLTALTRPAAPPTLVAFADTCASAIVVPETGGFFQGNTANAQADYDAGCDYGGLPSGGAAEQMLKLTLSSKKRVVLDMQGSAYSTLLNVRKGPACPGSELPLACAAGYYASRSYLDLELEAGQYWIQVDGYAGAAGKWFLDVYVVDP